MINLKKKLYFCCDHINCLYDLYPNETSELILKLLNNRFYKHNEELKYFNDILDICILKQNKCVHLILKCMKYLDDISLQDYINYNNKSNCLSYNNDAYSECRRLLYNLMIIGNMEKIDKFFLIHNSLIEHHLKEIPCDGIWNCIITNHRINRNFDGTINNNIKSTYSNRIKTKCVDSISTYENHSYIYLSEPEEYNDYDKYIEKKD